MSDPAGTFEVFIVDDDNSVRVGLSRLMRASGIASRAFATPEEFLATVTKASRGCVLLDITMPHITGPQVQIRLREMGIDLPVIAVSARDSDQARSLAQALGARFFLRKPVDDSALLDAISWVSIPRDGVTSGEER